MIVLIIIITAVIALASALAWAAIRMDREPDGGEAERARDEQNYWSNGL